MGTLQDGLSQFVDKRSIEGEKPEAPEIHGDVDGFTPRGDYILVQRLESVSQEGLIVKAEAYIELAERGHVIAVGARCDDVPLGVIAKFSKYGAEEIHFDDEGQRRFALVRVSDVRGWHNA